MNIESLKSELLKYGVKASDPTKTGIRWDKNVYTMFVNPGMNEKRVTLAVEMSGLILDFCVWGGVNGPVQGAFNGIDALISSL